MVSQALDRRQALAFVPQLAVGRVLEDDDVVLLGELHEPPAPGQAHRATRRVLVVGNGVDELDPLGGAQHLLEGVGVHSLLVHGHRAVVRLARVEGDQRTEEGRPLGDDDVAGVDEQLGREVQALLPALGDQDVVGGARHPVGGEPRSDKCPQLGQPVRGRVLQRRRVPRREQVVVDLVELVHREERGIRVAAGEGRDPGIACESEELTDRRRLHALGAVGERGHVDLLRSPVHGVERRPDDGVGVQPMVSVHAVEVARLSECRDREVDAGVLAAAARNARVWGVRRGW